MKPFLNAEAQQSLPYKSFLAEQVRNNEAKAAEQAGCTLYDLMERAGGAVLAAVQSNYTAARSFSVLIGSGNNGGDGLVFARLAKRLGLSVRVSSVVPDKALTGDAAKAKQAWLDEGGEIFEVDDETFKDSDVFVDALLGTGVTGEVSGNYASAITRLNQSAIPVVSIDIPSGLNADTGKPMGCAVEATMTVTLVGIKSGLVSGEGKHYCGNLVFDDLAIADTFSALAQANATLVNLNVLTPMPARPLHAHKGTFGRVLCIGGNRGMAGAARLAAEAALRTGAGLVKVFCHPDSCAVVMHGRPELMVASDNLGQQLAWADVVVLGPGLGQDSWSRGMFNEVVSFLMHEDLPVVIDADGLNLLSHHLYKLHLSNLVITPHPAEAARLLQTDTANVERDRFAAVKQLSARFEGSAVLKGAGSLVQTPTDTYVCMGGNPGMATAGMGDVLTGVIGGLMAQGLEHQHAAIFGTCLHAFAGDKAAQHGGQRGMLASDLISQIRHCINHHADQSFDQQ